MTAQRCAWNPGGFAFFCAPGFQSLARRFSTAAASTLRACVLLAAESDGPSSTAGLGVAVGLNRADAAVVSAKPAARRSLEIMITSKRYDGAVAASTLRG